MTYQISQDEEIQSAHASIDAFLSKKSASNNIFPEEVIRIAKQLFDHVYDAHDKLFKYNWPHPKVEVLIAAIIHAACRQCNGQARMFNEIANLTRENIAKIEKFFFIIDTWLYSMKKIKMKEEVKERKGEKREMKEERKEEWSEKVRFRILFLFYFAIDITNPRPKS